MSSDGSSKPKRWRHQYSLRTMLLVMLVLPPTIGYVGLPAYKWASRFWQAKPTANDRVTLAELAAALGPRIKPGSQKEIVIRLTNASSDSTEDSLDNANAPIVILESDVLSRLATER